MKMPENTTLTIIGVGLGLVAIVVIGYFVNSWLKQQKLDNANETIQKLPSSTAVFDASIRKIQRDGKNNLYTVYDPVTFYMNDTGRQILKTLDSEMYASFHTDDDSVLNALSQLKTKSDFGIVQRHFDMDDKLYHKGKGLLSLLASNLDKENYVRAIKIIDNLKTTI